MDISLATRAEERHSKKGEEDDGQGLGIQRIYEGALRAESEHRSGEKTKIS